MNPSPSRTVRASLDAAVRELSAAGIADARPSAEVLLGHVLRLARASLIARDDRVLTGDEAAVFAALVARRAAHEPVAYLTGEREFWSLPFAVNPGVLIPRPETELLVEEAVRCIDRVPAAMPAVCDVGTGSGIIPIVLKRERSRIAATGIDRIPAALEVARANARRHGVDVAWREGDLLAAVAGPVDVVTANLPYVPSADIAALEPDVRDHEPTAALDGGADGLDLIRRLVAQAHEKLGTGGFLLLEFGMGQAAAIESALHARGYSEIAIRDDYAAIARVAVARKA